MVKKLFILLFTVVLAVSFIYAQDIYEDDSENTSVSGNKKVEFTVSGEMKTGFYWEEQYRDGEKIFQDARIHHNSDAGTNEGRFRLLMHLFHPTSNIGMKVRFQQTSWGASQPNQFEYALAYGNFINDQLKVTIGKLGESPWAPGGPDLWTEVDAQVGLRFEVTPKVVPGLNIGLVLNSYDATPHNQELDTNFFLEMLAETVFGIRYYHEKYIDARVALRLDGKRDNVSYSTFTGEIIEDHMSLVYRLEERYFDTLIKNPKAKGFKIFANGYFKGLGEPADMNPADSVFSLQNFFYIHYRPEWFSSQLQLGYTINRAVTRLKARAEFYYNLFSSIQTSLAHDFLSIGMAFNYWYDIGDESGSAVRGVPFVLWGLEPKIEVRFNSNASIAFVYNYNQQYVSQGQGDPQLQERHWLNLRVVYTF